MRWFLDILTDRVSDSIENFENLVTNKPLISVLFPSTGFGTLFIPNSLTVNPVLDFINDITPYFKFVFLLLTMILTVISLILQVRKLKLKKDEQSKVSD